MLSSMPHFAGVRRTCGCLYQKCVSLKRRGAPCLDHGKGRGSSWHAMPVKSPLLMFGHTPTFCSVKLDSTKGTTYQVLQGTFSIHSACTTALGPSCTPSPTPPQLDVHSSDLLGAAGQL